MRAFDYLKKFYSKAKLTGKERVKVSNFDVGSKKVVDEYFESDYKEYDLPMLYVHVILVLSMQIISDGYGIREEAYDFELEDGFHVVDNYFIYNFKDNNIKFLYILRREHYSFKETEKYLYIGIKFSGIYLTRIDKETGDVTFCVIKDEKFSESGDTCVGCTNLRMSSGKLRPLCNVGSYKCIRGILKDYESIIPKRHSKCSEVQSIDLIKDTCIGCAYFLHVEESYVDRDMNGTPYNRYDNFSYCKEFREEFKDFAICTCLLSGDSINSRRLNKCLEHNKKLLVENFNPNITEVE